jgi:hypothetical protein
MGWRWVDQVNRYMIRNDILSNDALRLAKKKPVEAKWKGTKR